MRPLTLLLLFLAGPAAATSPGDLSVGSYHGAPDRSGHYIVPGLTWQSAKAIRRDNAFDGRVDGHIYAQPLYWQRPSPGSSLIIVATENDRVYGLDAGTGKVAWQSVVGQPVPRSILPCGNIDPVGITGTPVSDPAHGTIYFDAMVSDHGAPTHLIYGLRAVDGSMLPGFPINVGAQLGARGLQFDSAVQNQRGALALIGNKILIPYGGHFGDCGDYHGWVVAVSIDKRMVTDVWTTRALKGGIWAPAGLSEAEGALFFATGNTDGTREWHDGNAVFHVGADLVHSIDAENVFVPANWKQLDGDDLDLGGVTPLPLTLPGPTRLLIAFGKDGNAYLLDRMRLGGIGGALFTRRVAGSPIITAPAVYPVDDGVQVAYPAARVICPDGRAVAGIGALTVKAESGRKLRTAWCAHLDGQGAPIVTTSTRDGDPIVWEVGAEGDNRLHGLRGDNGQEILSAASGEVLPGLRHFVTILVAAGHFYIAGDGRVFAFTLPR